MVYAALDIGSNSVRLMVGEVRNKQVTPLYTGLRTTRLAGGLQEEGNLDPNACRKTLEAVRYFKEVLAGWGNPVLEAVATSAMRRAGNGAEFARQLSGVLQVPVRVLAGEEEANLSYQGAVSALEGDYANLAVVDIGGGSTEIALQLTNKLSFFSRPVGAVTCTQKNSTPSEILDLLQPALEPVNKAGIEVMLAVGGTATTLAAMAQNLIAYDPRLVQGYRLTRETVARQLFQLAGMSNAERKKLPGLMPERASIIVAGATILWVIMTCLDLDQVTVSEADLLHGIILELAARA